MMKLNWSHEHSNLRTITGSLSEFSPCRDRPVYHSILHQIWLKTGKDDVITIRRPYFLKQFQAIGSISNGETTSINKLAGESTSSKFEEFCTATFFTN